jgi:hypothetical protein
MKVKKNLMKMKKILHFICFFGLLISVVSLFLSSCTKEGPQGPAGPAGNAGSDGKDANETCKVCHTAAVVDAIATEFELAKHNWGEAAFAEAGKTRCSPCHEQKAFVYVCIHNTPATFTFNSATNQWVNDYSVPDSETIGEISCFTCHSNLHTTYDATDLALTTTAAVPMTMWGAAKTINLTQKEGIGNLCIKCHQPSPLTANTSYDPSGRLIHYDSLKNFPMAMQWDSTVGAPNNGIKPSYRTHVHYGVVGAVYAGMGAIEYPGSLNYENSPHTALASCQDCHMADSMYGIAGGHAFNMRNAKGSALVLTGPSKTTWNFNGCNVTGCHISDPLDGNSVKFLDTRSEIRTLLNALAEKINACGGGHDILHKSNAPDNLWAGITTNNYDGYLDIFDVSSNPAGYWKMDGTQPKFPKLLNVQLGALINFQFCLREYSLGIHNYLYVKALLVNTTEALTAAGL